MPMAEKDINEVFDDILLTEEVVEREGFSQGFKAGVQAGVGDGYHLGYHRGLQLGAELGFYLEQANIHSKQNQADKHVRELEKLTSLINSFPIKNDDNCDITVLLENIRACYKKCCALLKIDNSCPFREEISF